MNRLALVGLALCFVAACSSGSKEQVPADGVGSDVLSDGFPADQLADGTLPDGSSTPDLDPVEDSQEPDQVSVDLEPSPDLIEDICLPDCGERVCGDDGCGGSCGNCQEIEVCNELGACVPTPCASSKDCPGDLICYKELAICVECAVDADCLGEMRCTPEYTCYQPILCDSDKECKDADMVCDKDDGICVECLAHPDCADDQFCEAKFCLADICSAGEVGCDGAAIATCNDIGNLWLDAVACPVANYCEEGVCYDQVCNPGTAFCDETTRKLCDPLGKEIIEEEDCEPLDLVCVSGECLDLICVPNGPFCVNDGSLGQCSEDGLTFTEEACPEGTWCDGASCVPWLCTPGESVCADATVISTCNEFGSGPGGDGSDCADQDLCCLGGECVPPSDELCDNKDNNCNGEVDEGCDDDGDGFCDADALVLGKPTICPDGPGDCDDENDTIYPGNAEIAGDGIDNDCDGSTDEVETCPGPCTGHSVEAYLCALEMCLAPAVVSAEFYSPTGDNIEPAWEAVAHFGNLENDLAPWAGGSYGLLATGPAAGTAHSTDLKGGGDAPDPFSIDGYTTHDNVEFKVTLQVPQAALGFSIDYIFFSVEYEEYIGSSFNDKFYIIVQAPVSLDGQQEIINVTACSNPQAYHDVIDPVTGDKLCYMAINTAFSEPCTAPKTNIAGTGFACGSPDSAHGSSTGWLTTSWPVAPGETINLTFHVHDTSDGIYDSEVILDNFQWLYVPFVPGTTEKGLD
jgi:hypothetical protein